MSLIDRTFRSCYLPRISSLRLTALAVVATLTLSACETMDERSSATAKGAGIGAASGAIIGGISNNKNGVGRGAVIGAAIGAIGGNIWSRQMEAKREQMEAATKDTGVAVTRTEDNQLKLEVPSDISFDTSSATIQPRLRGVLEQFAIGLQHDPRLLVRVVGHTDSRGSEAINNPLSKARAESVRGFLEDRGWQPTASRPSAGASTSPSPPMTPKKAAPGTVGWRSSCANPKIRNPEISHEKIPPSHCLAGFFYPCGICSSRGCCRIQPLVLTSSTRPLRVSTSQL